MRILILYTLRHKKIRKTITEHLYSFEKYSPENKFIYVNVGSSGIPWYLKHISFDAIILHYTFLAGERFLPGKGWQNKIKGLAHLEGYKIAIPQDEYSYSGRLVQLFQDIGIDVIYTCFYKQEDIDFAYAQYLPKKVKCVPVFTGYIDENLIETISPQLTSLSDREIDIGYRASMLPAYLGKHGQLKYELIGEFNQRLLGSPLRTDIKSSNSTLTQQDSKAIKLGNEWNNFLLNCKAFIGSEGGASLLDFDGSIQGKVYDYSSQHPKATFREIEAACFPGKDFNISCFAISPRHFEAVITKTLQILVEGFYGGIFKAGIHYLELKKDYSNFDEVINQLADNEKCQQIVDRAYSDIALSRKYTYRSFVGTIISDIKLQNTISRNSRVITILLWTLQIRELYSLFFYKIFDALLYPYNIIYEQYFRHLRPYVRRFLNLN